jgi:uncharacterized membrane protein
VPHSEHASHSGHNHGGGDFKPASRAVRTGLIAVTLPLILANIVALALLWPRGGDNAAQLSSGPGTPLISATITDVNLVGCSGLSNEALGEVECIEFGAELKNGETTTFQQTLSGPSRPRIDDRVYLTDIGVDADGVVQYGFYEYQRERPLLLLGVLFVCFAVFIGRRSGLKALIALALSLFVLIKFMLPAIIAGRNPLLVALVGASAVMFLALYLSHGINVRTTSAAIGTVASLGLTGLIAWTAVGAANFTGLTSDNASYLRATSESIDLKGLLLAGVIIGALGVLDDVTVTQASAVWELHQANPALGFAGRYAAAMRIGRDHIASVVNTLVLAYAGAALPLLLLFSQAGTPLAEVLNGEPVATEVVRMLAGSIGLIAAVPITTALTSLVVGFDRDEHTRLRA